MRQIIKFIGLFVLGTLIVGCATTAKLLAPSTSESKKELRFYTENELKALAGAVNKMEYARCGLPVDSDGYVRIKDGPFMNQLLIPSQLRRDAYFFSGKLFKYLDAYTLYGRVQYSYKDCEFSFNRVYPYSDSELTGFFSYLSSSRLKNAQAVFSKNRKTYPWLDQIEGTYGDLEIKIKDGVCLIRNKKERAQSNNWRWQPDLYIFISADKEYSFQAARFKMPRTLPSPVKNIVGAFGSPLVTNGFAGVEMVSFSFTNDFSVLEVDNRTYRHKDRWNTFCQRKCAEEEAEKTAVRQRREEDQRRRKEENARKLQEINERAEELVRRCKLEAVKKSPLCIKGFYLGMKRQDAEELAYYYYQDVFKFQPCSDVYLYAFTPAFLDTDKNGNVSGIILKGPLVEKMFNASGLKAGEFIQEFINYYGIPEVKSHSGTYESWWEYRSLDSGFMVRVFDDKSIYLVSIKNKAELSFD